MNFSNLEISEFLDAFEDRHNPVIHKTLQISKREKVLSFKVESRMAEGSGDVTKKFFISHDKRNYVRLDKTNSRIIFSIEDPQRDALLKKRNFLHKRLTPETVKTNPEARRMYDKMMEFHERLNSDEFLEPRYVMQSPDRKKFEQMFLNTPARYTDFTPDHKETLIMEFLPNLKKILPDPKISWWDIKRRIIGGTEFNVFETYDNQQGKRELFKRFILSHVEETERMSMVYGLDSKNKVSFLFGFYPRGMGRNKLGSVNDRLLFPKEIVAIFNEMDKGQKTSEQTINKSFY